MTFWFMATPYTKWHAGIEDAHRMACIQAAVLMKAGVPVYSPIAHTHPIAIHGGIDPTNHDIWLPAEECFLRASKGLIVVTAQGWQDSKGVRWEIEQFDKANKTVLFMTPGVVPKGIF